MPSSEEKAIEEVGALVDEYEQFLWGKAPGTRQAYLRTVRHLIGWMAQLAGYEGPFQLQQLTQTAVELYLAHLEQEGFSQNHRARVKSTISNFANFLIEEKGLLQRNPTRGIELLPARPLAPVELSEEQRSLLHSLVEQAADRRGAALFALGYWAGCRVSEVSWLQMAHTHVDPKEGWLHVGQNGSKGRDIDLVNQARQPLYEYLQATRDRERIYVFTSQRSQRLTEQGIYFWFRTLKAQVPKDQGEVIEHLTFHDLRYDFAQRAREAGWSLAEVASYLGYVTKQGVPAMQTTVGSPPISREQVKQKLKDIKG
jgi:site-specific recombinase XerD